MLSCPVAFIYLHARTDTMTFLCCQIVDPLSTDLWKSSIVAHIPLMDPPCFLSKRFCQCQQDSLLNTAFHAPGQGWLMRKRTTCRWHPALLPNWKASVQWWTPVSQVFLRLVNALLMTWNRLSDVLDVTFHNMETLNHASPAQI